MDILKSIEHEQLKNKTYKLLPLREEKLQWEKHLETILIEISGFNSITVNQQVKIISVLSHQSP